jgi:hypothetical protein
MKQIVHTNLVMLVAGCLFTMHIDAQASYEQFYLKRQNFEDNLSELRIQFGNKKIIPAEIELECLTALSFYPELKNTDIEFRFGNLNFTMISQPKFKSIFYDRTRRQYVITIQKQGLSKNSIDWRELSFNAMVGWIGHELGHVLHYSHKSSGGILLIGMKYAVPGYRRKMERFTDQLAIQHHLGYALYEGVEYTLSSSRASEHYKQSQEKFYLQPEEIIARICSTESWSTVFRKTRMEHHLQVNPVGSNGKF